MSRHGAFSLRRSITRPSSDVLARFREFTTPNLSDAMGKRQTLRHGIRPVHLVGDGLIGPAVTVQTRPGDNLMPMKAIEVAQPGDVIVIVGAGEDYSVWGGIMTLMADSRGIAGMVTDGLVRDLAQIRTTGVSVFAAGVSPIGPTKSGVGSINSTVSCAGIVIEPGDLIRGDEDGVVVIPRGQVDRILGRVEARVATEIRWMEEISMGEFSLIDSDERLESLGCELEDRGQE